MKASVILASFSPVDAELPKKHFQSTLDFLLSHGHDLEVCVAQVVRKGQEPVPTAGAATSLVFESEDKVFFKENLWNLAAAHAISDKFIFIDADLHYKDTDWLDQICAALDEYDVIQPFDIAQWEMKNGEVNPTMRKSAWFNAIIHGGTPVPETYHPGFGFAMTRKHFNAIGGFYEHGVMGEGDHMFCVAHTPQKQIEYVLQFSLKALNDPDSGIHPDIRAHWKNLANHFLSHDYIDWKSNIQSMDFKAGVATNLSVYHRWHGTAAKRQYTTRLKYLKWPESGKPARSRDDGLLEWVSPQPEVDEWWDARDDDGTKSEQISLNRYIPVE